MKASRNGHSALRDQLLAVPLRQVAVEIPGYPCLYLRELTAAERLRYENEVLDPEKRNTEYDVQSFLAIYVARHLVDAEGNRLFGDSPEEIELLSNRVSIAVLKRLFEEAQKLLTWTEDTFSKAKAELNESPLSTP